jgi:hypothetical protein
LVLALQPVYLGLRFGLRFGLRLCCNPGQDWGLGQALARCNLIEKRYQQINRGFVAPSVCVVQEDPSLNPLV